MRQIHFKHNSGSQKHIPGVSSEDLQPRMIQTTQYESQIGQYVSVMQKDPSHVVKINLLSEDPNEGLDALTKLPDAVRRRMEDNLAQEYVDRLNANKTVRSVLDSYAKSGAIEIVFEGDVDPDEVKASEALSIDLSEIALADHVARGIPIPEHVQRKTPSVVKRAERAAQKGARKDTPPVVIDTPEVSDEPQAGVMPKPQSTE